jgi:hypothetical protein
MNTNKPRRGELYTIEQILKMDLPDTPCLMVPAPAKFGIVGSFAIQDPDMGWEAAAKVMEGMVFEYDMTTHEMIPVFRFADDPIVAENDLDIELDLMPYFGKPACWIVPKGDTRKQDYRWNEVGVSVVSEYTDPQPAPQWLIDAYNKIAK